ncbi:acetyl-CoA hydrolase/transferase family protein [Meiothermus sp. QL-1]|uniref:acetyl-CoA hydrolase/transferase family protein n=1 Tax=Meiothermus sp. QL-1 TaxID=2058095 RepID=UPI000E0B6599|nr:acetyl-CoA hydrolase/transferase C-terminal domain-containing protein [Meiothermus sp. QL-1]RDI96691.1 acetyl-CoA hydrolase/transferase family protein [Meiothermus sp. QL-1]
MKKLSRTGKALGRSEVQKLYRSKRVDLETAVGMVRSHTRVYVSGNAATPTPLLEALAARKDELEGVELVHVLQLGPDPFLSPEMEGHFRRRSLFVGPADREAVNSGRADYVPISLHQVPWLFKRGVLPLDYALVQVSPPDEFGFVSLGVEVIATKAAIETARRVIALVNRRMPRTLGDAFVHISKFAAFVEVEFPLPTLARDPYGEVEARIGRYVADLIEDGATLQLGIGAIPDAVLAHLSGRQDLGIHTEMISDGVMEALERGIVTGQRKTLLPGKVVGTFVLGSERLYRFVHNNPLFEMRPADWVNDPFVIARNERMVAVNSALEVDLTGQVCADSLGIRIYSGFGGQLDFIRGAAASRGGKPIIALPSTGKGGSLSRIVPMLKPGAGVVTTRADVHYVVTEYGVAELFGKSLRERAQALIQIAHPSYREALSQAAFERGLLPRGYPGFGPTARG